MTRNRQKLLVALVSLLAAGCNIGLPPEPTVPVMPTETATLTPSASPTLPTRTPTSPPSEVPQVATTAAPAVTLRPSDTPLPPTATPDETASIAPTVVSTENGLMLLLSEAQINAALARQFDSAPLVHYAIAPHVTLTNGAMHLIMRIVPQSAPAGSGPQTITLNVALSAPGGILETVPTQLVPLNSGVSTQQVKRGEMLLLQVLSSSATQAAGGERVFVSSAEIRPDGITFVLVRAGG